MTIKISSNDNTLTVAVGGRFDTLSSSDLERQLVPALDGAEKLIFDFAELEYLSSAGLRVLLATEKEMNARGGEMIVTKVSPEVMEVFELTGFVNILNIE